jgi:hypothetical protein
VIEEDLVKVVFANGEEGFLDLTSEDSYEINPAFRAILDEMIAVVDSENQENG